MSLPTCPSCGRETNPMIELGGTIVEGELSSAAEAESITRRCGHLDCKAPLPAPASSAPAAARARGGPAKSPPRVAAKSPAPEERSPVGFASIVAQMKDRLLYVRGEIALRDALVEEEREIVSALTAMGQSPDQPPKSQTRRARRPRRAAASGSTP